MVAADIIYDDINIAMIEALGLVFIRDTFNSHVCPGWWEVRLK